MQHVSGLTNGANSDKNKSSFTSLSENLGSIIRDVHQGLIYGLAKEQSKQVLTLMMHIATVLVENCSYERLSKSHLPSIYYAVADHWKEQSKCARMEAASILTSYYFLGLHGPILKVIASVFSIYQDNLKELIQTDVIEQIILKAVSNQNEDEEAQVEVWRTCSTLTRCYFKDTMPMLWQKLIETTSNLPISAASLKFMESYASAIHESGEVTQQNVSWWQTVIESYLQKAATDEDVPPVRAAACDCFASMSRDIFETFHVSTGIDDVELSCNSFCNLVSIPAISGDIDIFIGIGHRR